MQKILKLYGFKGVIDARESMDGSKYGPGWIKSGLPVMPYNPEQAQAKSLWDRAFSRLSSP
jgi:hypothetical protein